MPKTKSTKKKIEKKTTKHSAGVKISAASKPEIHKEEQKTRVAKKEGTSVTVYGADGKATGQMTLPKELFGVKVNKPLLAQAVRVYLANQREGSASTKTRGEVEGSTRKIYRQKGTGKARHGGIRAPIFVGGGITFGPKPRDYSRILPKKMKSRALASALTGKLEDGGIHVVDGLSGLPSKTKAMAHALSLIGATKKTLLVTSGSVPAVEHSARNIRGVTLIPARNIHAYIILTHPTVVLMKEAIDVLSKTFI